MKRAYVEIPEGQIHYQIDGDGDPVLLIHATPTSSDEYFQIMPVLGKAYKVEAMNTLGYGKSDKPSHCYEISDYAQGVIHFLSTLDLKKTSIIGNLTGAA